MKSDAASAWAVAGGATFAVAAAISVALIIALTPWLRRIALAKPNARSSHREPTPQGGGIAVIAATIVAACGALYWSASAATTAWMPWPVFAAAILIAALGSADDIRSIGVAPRLLLQAFAVALVIFTLPGELRVAPFLPWWIERAALVVGGLWFVNLVNFMDGLDWMTVAEVVPVTAALAAVGVLGFLPPAATITSFALCGAMIGFAYFNRPVAKLFLGDVGSLPIGLLLGWLLAQLAGHHGLAAAILLPLYYLADATITLIRRLLNGEPVWQAHRSHFYQRATDRGFTVRQVVAHVFAVNFGLAALALFTLAAPGLLNDIAALVCGAALVAWLLLAFARGKSVIRKSAPRI
jgi:UDP-N-acetylmuramyl pentapeptide phosphotransferase/UDP-N-acetylglucosamine-1-phosphate transferase